MKQNSPGSYKYYSVILKITSPAIKTSPAKQKAWIFLSGASFIIRIKIIAGNRNMIIIPASARSSP